VVTAITAFWADGVNPLRARRDRRVTAKFAIGISLIVLLAAACGGGTSYEDSVRDIAEERDAATARVFEVLGPLQPGVAADVTFLAGVAEEVPELVREQRRAIDTLEELSPPREYENDHVRFIAGLQELLKIDEQIVVAAESREILSVGRLLAERDSAERRLVNELSEGFVELAYTSQRAAVFAARAGGLTAAESAYIESLDAAFEEFRARNAEFGVVVRGIYPNPGGMFAALERAGAGTAFEAVQERVSVIEPPASLATDHVAVTAFLDEAVRLDREIGRAVREVDVTLFVLANEELGKANRTVAPTLHPAVCGAIGGGFCNAPGLNSSEYLQQVRGLMFELAAEFPPRGPWATFALIPPVANADLFDVVAVVGPRAVVAIEGATGALAALTPPGDLASGHQRLLDFLEQSESLQNAIVGSAAAEDGDAMRDAIDGTANAYCTAAVDVGEMLVDAARPYFGAGSLGSGGLGCG
jgi:hypothetical protein